MIPTPQESIVQKPKSFSQTFDYLLQKPTSSLISLQFTQETKYLILAFNIRFVETCMQHVQQGMNDEEAVKNAVKTLEFGKQKTTMSMHDVCVV